MSINTKEKPKKEKDKEKKSKESIPDTLQNIPEPETNTEIEPPRPISFQESKGDVPKPTRLPPRFKERFQPRQQEKPAETSQEPETPISFQQQEQLEKQEKQEQNSSSYVVPPVKIRQRRESIPTVEKEPEKKFVQPT